MKIVRVDHLGIAVKDLAKAEAVYCGLLGFRKTHAETLPEMKLNVSAVEAGGVTLELLEPRDGETTISRFLASRGEGFHHISLEVDDIRSATRELRDRGLRPVWDEPRIGAGGKMVNFLRPADTSGVLIELSQTSVETCS